MLSRVRFQAWEVDFQKCYHTFKFIFENGLVGQNWFGNEPYSWKKLSLVLSSSMIEIKWNPSKPGGDIRSKRPPIGWFGAGILQGKNGRCEIWPHQTTSKIEGQIQILFQFSTYVSIRLSFYYCYWYIGIITILYAYILVFVSS